MSEIIQMDVFGKKENIIEMRIKGDIVPFYKNHEFLLTDTLDGKIVLAIKNTMGESLRAIFDSDEFLKEIEEYLKIKKERSVRDKNENKK